MLGSVNRGVVRVLVWIGLAVGLAASLALAEPPGRWVAGDFHHHSRLTDGSYSPQQVFDRGLNSFGLSWMANSEHGGAFGRNADGRYWGDPAIKPPVEILGKQQIDKEKRRYMWRWQSLYQYSWPILADVRNDPKYAKKALMLGLEFNCPGHDHVSVAILADSGLPIAEFEYRFDGNDNDDSGGPEGKWKDKNTQNDHAKALQAIAWLDEHHRDRSWFIANHPERAGKVRIEDLRDYNNTAPLVAFGFEGAPGHQKHGERGGFADKSFRYADNGMGGSTYGGVGVFVARVGGVWDALLGEGRPFFAFANSDFHDEGRDFFPGEYQKTYVRVSGPVTGQSVLEGLRAGRAFFVSGDLVDAVEFEALGSGQKATLGETLQVRPGTDVQVRMRFHDPAGKNKLGDEATLRSIDLIGGDITGPVKKHLEDGKTPNPAYTVDMNPSARVLAHFDDSTWQTAGGWVSASFTLKALDHDMYLRLRGTNLPPGTEHETDADGNPLSDTEAEKAKRDGLAEARADLWVYANPIFLRVQKDE